MDHVGRVGATPTTSNHTKGPQHMSMHLHDTPVEQLEHLADQLDRRIAQTADQYRTALRLRNAAQTALANELDPVLTEGHRAHIRLLTRQLEAHAVTVLGAMEDRCQVAAAFTAPHTRAVDPRDLHPSRWEDPEVEQIADAIHRRDNGGL